MNLRRILTVGLFAVVTAGAAFFIFSRDSAQTALEETRRELRQQGFKIDLSEFDLSASAEFRARAVALTNANLTGAGLRSTDPARRSVLLEQRPVLMQFVGSNAALVVWKQAKLPAQYAPNPWEEQAQFDGDLWPVLRAIMNEDRAVLDAACEAARSGPIRFDLASSQGLGLVLRHLQPLRGLTQILGTRALLELHDGHQDAAWTNLLAATWLVKAWEPEPAEVSHLVRFTCATLAYNGTWEALQAGGWADDRLALLQREWEAVDFFHGLPETAAFSRASAAAVCQRDRQEPLATSPIFGQLLRSPRSAWIELSERWYRLRYRHHGSYDDERALLLYYRDRELQVRRAVQAPTWSEMRGLPGVTNTVPFQSQYRSRVQAILNMRQMNLRVFARGQGLVGRAAESETRRRLVITAIALERYRGRHGGYPKSLQELVPELLKGPPIDFMDGKPLRYRLADDGHFVLYSVGLDGAVEGRKLLRSGRRGAYGDGPYPGLEQAAPLIWPRPASMAEVLAQKEEDEGQAQMERAAQQKHEAAAEQRAEIERQATVERMLAEAAAGKAAPQRSAGKSSAEPTFQGRPLSALLRNEKTGNNLTLDEMLTASQVTTGEYDGTVIFEVPVSYNAATNLGRLHLVVDRHLDTASLHEEVERQTCERAANGNCLLSWNTTYDPPGKHAIQAEFIATKDEDKEETALKAKGPVVAFVSTNLCQFDSAFDRFDARGMTLYARLPESNGVYTIELEAPAGVLRKTLTGTTADGVIKVQWDLIDDHGLRCTNEMIDSVFKVTLPASGRSQTLKGP